MVVGEVEGKERWVLAENVEHLQADSPLRSVRLLAGFDQYLLGPTHDFALNTIEVSGPLRRDPGARRFYTPGPRGHGSPQRDRQGHRARATGRHDPTRRAPAVRQRAAVI
ncbi:MAG: hypothetical protein M3Y17_07400 [Actinomycetota bacterium]|nr:hypothetical protein [Actinomycetota bacterium]